MVVFTCNGCGESLKKAQVEKHLVKCKSCRCLSCIDCGKDFWGDKYTTHLKCVTEDEKYGGKAFEAKASKGDVKQQQWIQRIQEAMKKPNVGDNIRNILTKISTYDNVPRKKAKFQNWMINCLKIQNQGVQDEVWECFSEAASNQQKDNANNNASKPSSTSATQSTSESSAATEETEKKSKREQKEERQKKNKKEKKDLNSEEQLQNGTKKKGKKRKMEDDVTGNEANDEASGKKKRRRKKKKKQRKLEGEGVSENKEEQTPEKKKRNDSEGKVQEEEADESEADDKGEEDSGKRGKFNWKGTIKALLKQAPDNELPIKKLRKKVIAQYHVISSGQHRSEEELLAMFKKKIHNNPKFRVLKEKVKLVK